MEEYRRLACEDGAKAWGKVAPERGDDGDDDRGGDDDGDVDRGGGDDGDVDDDDGDDDVQVWYLEGRLEHREKQVSELTAEVWSSTRENGRLKEQVEKLQGELRGFADHDDMISAKAGVLAKLAVVVAAAKAGSLAAAARGPEGTAASSSSAADQEES